MKNLELKEEQKKALKFILDTPRSGLFMQTGCISGSALIRVNRCGKSFDIRLYKLYCSYHDRDKLHPKHRFDLSHKTYVRSDVGGRFGLNEIIDVVYSGRKELFRLTLSNGLNVDLTADHEILTDKGFIRLDKLSVGDNVAFDEMKHKKVGTQPKIRDICVTGLDYHPYGRRVKSLHYSGSYTYRVVKHRLICEAKLNNMSYDEFVEIIRKDKEKASKLIFLDPKVYVVHHKDGNHFNNESDNLEPEASIKHLKSHGDIYTKNFTINQICYSVIKSIESVGVDDTYDIKCKSPHHNFTANRIVVHNCGKTIVSLLYLKVLGRPALVIAPAHIIRHQIWQKENVKFGLGMDISSDYRVPSPQITMISYDTVKNTPEILNDYDIVVLEEAHCIADTQTIRYKNLSELIKLKERVVMLAGYPVENRLTEIYVVSLITDVLGKHYNHFLNKFFTVIRHKTYKNRIIKAIPKKGSADKIIELISPFVFVSDKKLFFDTPVKKENMIIRFELSDYQKNMINELRENFAYQDEHVSLHCKNELVVFGKVMQIVSGFVYETDDENEVNPVRFEQNPKLDLLCRVIAGKSDFLLWYLFDFELEMLRQHGNRCRLSKLQTDSRGLNLQHYKFSVYFTLPLSGGQFLQSVDRLYRIGRVDDVLSVILLPNGDFGDRMLRMTRDKHGLTKKFIKDLLAVRL